MSQEERRAAIVRSTLPLLIEHGGNVSTSQIAAAAGIAEGTVFRAFKDKQDLLVACMQAGMNSDDEVARIEAHRARRAASTGGSPRAFARSAATSTGSGPSGRPCGPAGSRPRPCSKHMHGDDETPRARAAARDDSACSRAMSGLFDAATDNLRVDPERAVRMLLGLVLTNRMQGDGFGQPIDDPAEIVDLFLHGVIHTRQEGNQR